MAMKASDPLSLSRSWFIISKYMRTSILTPQAIASDVGRDSFACRFLLKNTLVATWVSAEPCSKGRAQLSNARLQNCNTMS